MDYFFEFADTRTRAKVLRKGFNQVPEDDKMALFQASLSEGPAAARDPQPPRSPIPDVRDRLLALAAGADAICSLP